METLAPPVVAVIVACDPGSWFAETLRAFATQDYPELSVLVLDAGSAEDPSPVVARELPGAFVRLLGENRGFAASANEAMSMVEGATFFLFCHDDVAPAPDAVHLLVEESYRSNAGVVGPKLVSWDDPERLLHVGMGVDKGGAVVDRVEPGEIDHGQHDAVRDVFLAPGGCTLVRADLFKEIGGFDPDIFAMGEDLDLCWRAQIAGARVLVAPQARVRHLELLASGRRPLPPSVIADVGGPGADGPGADGAAEGRAAELAPLPLLAEPAPAAPSPGEPEAKPEANGDRPVETITGREPRGRTRRPRPLPALGLQSLQRRHELHAVLKAYGRFHLARVLPQLMALASAEYWTGRASGHRDRAAAVAHAWRWNFVRRRAIRAERAMVQAHRLLDDSEVRRLQLRGSARLNAYVRRAVNSGLRAAHRGGEGEDVDEDRGAADERRRRVRAEALRLTGWAVAVVVLLFGLRQLIGAGFPYLGQLLPLPSAGQLLHRFVSGWQPTGVGTTDPTSPATGILGVGGFILLGGVGLLQKIVVLGCIPLGAIGMARLTRPLSSQRARFAATIVYLAVPLPYDALATGRWDALVAYAGSPWVVAFLARASGLAPFGSPPQEAPPARARWRTTSVGRVVALGLLDAVVCSVSPSVGLVVLVAGVGLALGSILTEGAGALRQAARIAGTALGATVVAFVLLMPWSVSLVSGPGRFEALTGPRLPSAAAPGWSALLRFAVGPIGNSPLVWAFLVAAGLPLVIGSRWRLGWAGRAWTMAVVAWIVTWASARGWLGAFAPDPEVLLAPAAAGVAFSIGLGASSFERDLPAYRFGWRQAASTAAAVAAVIGVLPVLVASWGGRFDLPASGYGQATSWMRTHGGAGDFRVLWLGDPRVLPGSGWQIAPGLDYSITEDGLGDATAVWPGSSPGPAARVGQVITLARSGKTVQVGALLAPYAVRYVVVVDSLAPSIPGLQSPVTDPPPPDLEPALLAQLDLRQIIGQGGFQVFVDDAAATERQVVSSSPSSAGTVTPVLPAPSGATAVAGPVPAGTLVVRDAPSRSWELVAANGHVVRPRAINASTAAFTVARSGRVTVRFAGSTVQVLEVAGEVVLWLVVAFALFGRRRWMASLFAVLLRRRHSAENRVPDDATDAPDQEVPEPVAVGATSGDRR
jgi:GT2 family glycosyltransferase